jgi:hypothetical protein
LNSGLFLSGNDHTPDFHGFSGGEKTLKFSEMRPCPRKPADYLFSFRSLLIQDSLNVGKCKEKYTDGISKVEQLLDSITAVG